MKTETFWEYWRGFFCTLKTRQLASNISSKANYLQISVTVEFFFAVYFCHYVESNLNDSQWPAAELKGFVRCQDNCARCQCRLPCDWHMANHVTQPAWWWDQRNQEAIKKHWCQTTGSMNGSCHFIFRSVAPLATNTTLRQTAWQHNNIWFDIRHQQWFTHLLSEQRKSDC